MTYRARSVPPTSDWGRFLVRMRKERDWSAVQAHEALHDGLGLRLKSKASYTALEDGKEPSPAQAAFLRSYFGGGPTDEDRDPMEKPGEGEATPTLAGLSDLVASLSELVGELRAARLERDDLVARVRALEAAAMLRGGSDAGAPEGLGAPHQIEG